MAIPLQAGTWEEYRSTFSIYTKTQNPEMPIEASDRLAAVNWGLAKGQWAMARRLAAKGTAESHYKVVAWVQDRESWSKIPRTDPYGCHYALLALEAFRLGLLPSWRDWKLSDEWTALKKFMTEDPTLGAFLAGSAYVRIVEKAGSMDKAESVWAQNPDYLTLVKFQEVVFERVRRAPARVAVKTIEGADR